MVTAALREPSDAGSAQTTSSLTVSWGPVNLAAESGAGKVRDVLVVEPSTETWWLSDSLATQTSSRYF